MDFQRKGATSLKAVPPAILLQLEAGEIETVNLMEWLRTDMSALAETLTAEMPGLAPALREAADGMRGLGLTARLKVAGATMAFVSGGSGTLFEKLATHRSDIVRQWACYAVNDMRLQNVVNDRLLATLRFANDRNMSVRETAWMAFRPHLPADPKQMVELLLPLADSPSENVRRFSIEVARPRSVWGAHIVSLKQDPGVAAHLLDKVMADDSRYVRLAVGNWLNDAAKTRPDWVKTYCARWAKCDHRHTRFIIRRGSRTIVANRAAKSNSDLLDIAIGEAA